MRSTVQVDGAPKAIGPYSQAQVIRLHGGNRLVFTSGQVALDPASGKMVEGGIAAQTERALQNLGAVLAGAGVDYTDVVKTTVFLIDMNDFTEMNQVYERFFPAPAPARSTVAVAALPRGSRVEVEALAIGRDA
jgi:2-iminobutanoate/2-iminopropanoate deaminase